MRLLLVSLFFSLATAAFAQNPFPFQLGSAGQEYGKCAAKTADGGIVIGMLFQNTVDFDPGAGTATLGTPPGIDCAIVKYAANGAVVWARHISGPTTGASAAVTITPHGITTDASGNVIVIGYFGLAGSATQATVDFDPGAGVANLTNTGGWDPFIWKLDANGNFVWTRTFGSTTPNTATDERCWDVAADSTGAVYVSGFIQGTYDLDAGAGVASFTSAGEKDTFLVKYDASGTYVWGFTIADTGDTATSLKENSVCLDALGHVFLAGHFNGTADFNPGAGTNNLTSAGQADMFIARYDLNGSYQMAVRLGGTFNDTAPPGTVRCDENSNVYMTGKFRGTVDLNPGAAVNSVTNAGTTDNIWVSSYTSDLAYRWGFSITSGNGLDGGHRVAFDASGGLFVAGWFSGVNDFDGSAATYNLTSTNNAAGAASDIFIAKYNRDTGGFMWARGFGGTVTDQTDLSITAGLAVDATGNAYVTGQFYGTGATFYDAAGQQANAPTWNSVGNNDGYVIKYDPNGNLWQPAIPTVTAAPQSSAAVASGSVTFTITASGVTPLLYQWQRNGVTIANATSASYTLTGLTLADHGAQFTCIISNYGGTTTSTAATLSVFATPIEVWRFNYFGTNANTGNAADDADPDGDGVVNLFEYATGTSPLVNNPSPFLSGTIGGYLTLSVAKAAVSGITWSAESCDDLTSWSPASVTVLTDNSGAFQARDNFTTGASSKRFLRLKVTYP